MADNCKSYVGEQGVNGETSRRGFCEQVGQGRLPSTRREPRRVWEKVTPGGRTKKTAMGFFCWSSHFLIHLPASSRFYWYTIFLPVFHNNLLLKICFLCTEICITQCAFSGITFIWGLERSFQTVLPALILLLWTKAVWPLYGHSAVPSRIKNKRKLSRHFTIYFALWLLAPILFSLLDSDFRRRISSLQASVVPTYNWWQINISRMNNCPSTCSLPKTLQTFFNPTQLLWWSFFVSPKGILQ